MKKGVEEKLRDSGVVFGREDETQGTKGGDMLSRTYPRESRPLPHDQTRPLFFGHTDDLRERPEDVTRLVPEDLIVKKTRILTIQVKKTKSEVKLEILDFIDQRTNLIYDSYKQVPYELLWT